MKNIIIAYAVNYNFNILLNCTQIFTVKVPDVSSMANKSLEIVREIISKTNINNFLITFFIFLPIIKKMLNTKLPELSYSSGRNFSTIKWCSVHHLTFSHFTDNRFTRHHILASRV
ncbi:MAG: hypothetical protein HQK92_09770 [Nitrospirae bacterium]|nr:hypothetical protein [Nitrospirota bacterium]